MGFIHSALWFCFACCTLPCVECSKTAFTQGFAVTTAPNSDNDLGHSQNLVTAIDCVFSSDTCFWKQSTNDTFDWSLGSGSTSSTGTGPNADHTGTGARKYVFIEASAPRRGGDYAILASHRLEPKNHQKMCFSFWYNMYGTNIGSLSVFNERLLETHTEVVKVWSKSGNQGNNWYKGEAPIDPPGPMRILINATVGSSGYRGDIAIDDLTLSVSNCSQYPITERNALWKAKGVHNKKAQPFPSTQTKGHFFEQNSKSTSDRLHTKQLKRGRAHWH